MPVEESSAITARNKAIFINNKAALDLWKVNGEQGKKPQNKRTVDQTLGCFCYKQNCRMSGSGLGCYLCFKKKGVINLIPDPNGGPSDYICDCDVCRCKCSVFFSRSKYHDFYHQHEFEKKNKSAGKFLI